MTSCLLTVLHVSSEKGSTLKRKELTLKGDKLFSFRVYLLNRGGKNNLIELSPLDVCPFPLMLYDVQSK